MRKSLWFLVRLFFFRIKNCLSVAGDGTRTVLLSRVVFNLYLDDVASFVRQMIRKPSNDPAGFYTVSTGASVFIASVYCVGMHARIVRV